MQNQDWDNLQHALAQQVIRLTETTAWREDTRILSLDVQYNGEEAFVAGDFQTLAGEWLGTFVGKTTVEVPYLPGYFAFREGPVLEKYIHYWQKQTGHQADLVVIDGHGIAHPRKLGVASWLGVKLSCPTIGCAKESLLHFEGDLAEERGSTLPILLGTEKVGVALRTQKGINPIFVSAGHQISLEDAIDITLRLSSTYRIPDNLRRADQYARQAFRGEPAREWKDIGTF